MRIKKGNWTSLELFKGLGVLLMLGIHSIAWLVPFEEFKAHSHENYLRFLNLIFYVGFIPLLLPATAGSTVHETILELRSTKKRFTYSTIMFSGFILVVAGYALNYFSFSSENLLHWDALSFLGICVLLSSLLGACTELLVITLIVCILALTPALRILFSGSNGYWATILVGGKFSNWPLFPWASLFFYGYLIAQLRARSKTKNLFLRTEFVLFNLFVLCVCGPLMIAQYILSLKIWGQSLFQMPISLVVAVLSSYGISLSVLEFYQLKFPKSYERIRDCMQPFSQGSFWIFILHVAFGYKVARWCLLIPLGKMRFVLFIPVLVAGSWWLGRLIMFMSSKKLKLTLIKSPLTKVVGSR